MNEIKGTRMPDYSNVSKDRDIYGELGWIPNFNVKCSKNNHIRHVSNREYFDGPMNYHVTFNNSTMNFLDRMLHPSLLQESEFKQCQSKTGLNMVLQ